LEKKLDQLPACASSEAKREANLPNSPGLYLGGNSLGFLVGDGVHGRERVEGSVLVLSKEVNELQKAGLNKGVLLFNLLSQSLEQELG
jgi:hypothetical protein